MHISPIFDPPETVPATPSGDRPKKAGPDRSLTGPLLGAQATVDEGLAVVLVQCDLGQ
jgi:hypothetical protein